MPIPGTTKLHRLEENIRAPNVQLTADDLTVIERAASAITVKGERYPEQLYDDDWPVSGRLASQEDTDVAPVGARTCDQFRSVRRRRGIVR